MKDRQPISRRDFLKLSVAGLAALYAPAEIVAARQETSVNCYPVTKFGSVSVQIDRTKLYDAIANSLLTHFGSVPVNTAQILDSTKFLFNFDELYQLYTAEGGRQSYEKAKKIIDSRSANGFFDRYNQTPLIYIDLEKNAGAESVTNWTEYEDRLHTIFRAEIGHLTNYVNDPDLLENLINENEIFPERFIRGAGYVADGFIGGALAGVIPSKVVEKITKDEGKGALAGLAFGIYPGIKTYQWARDTSLAPATFAIYVSTDMPQHEFVDTQLSRNSVSFNQNACGI